MDVGVLVIVAEGDGLGVMVGVLVGGKEGMAVRVGGNVDVAVTSWAGGEVGVAPRSGAMATAISPRQ